MDFYEKKRRAFIDIDFMLNKGKSFSEIYLHIASEYGFSKKIIEERIKMKKNVKDVKQ